MVEVIGAISRLGPLHNNDRQRKEVPWHMQAKQDTRASFIYERASGRIELQLVVLWKAATNSVVMHLRVTHRVYQSSLLQMCSLRRQAPDTVLHRFCNKSEIQGVGLYRVDQRQVA